MRIPRIHHPHPLAPGLSIELEPPAAQHVGRVLRMRPGEPLVLFNGEGGEYPARLESVERRSVTALVEGFDPREAESPLAVTLAQGVSKGERMDYALQKAVELGVSRFVPVFTERSAVGLKGERLEKRRLHWQGVAIAACEQCGRNRIPEVLEPLALGEWLARPEEGLRLTLDPAAGFGLAAAPPPATAVTLLIGPEGGLSEAELAAAMAAGYLGVRLGPRVLRTETAAVAAVAAIQLLWGDGCR